MEPNKENISSSLIELEISESLKSVLTRSNESSNIWVDGEEAKSSDFDRVLIKTWQNAMDAGLFKFKLHERQPYRYLEGKYSFIVQVG